MQVNRRKFITALAIAFACPAILARPLRWTPNPKWVNAEYEIVIVDAPPLFDERILEADPCRYANQFHPGAYTFTGRRFELREGIFYEVFP